MAGRITRGAGAGATCSGGLRGDWAKSPPCSEQQKLGVSTASTRWPVTSGREAKGGAATDRHVLLGIVHVAVQQPQNRLLHVAVAALLGGRDTRAEDENLLPRRRTARLEEQVTEAPNLHRRAALWASQGSSCRATRAAAYGHGSAMAATSDVLERGHWKGRRGGGVQGGGGPGGKPPPPPTVHGRSNPWPLPSRVTLASTTGPQGSTRRRRHKQCRSSFMMPISRSASADAPSSESIRSFSKTTSRPLCVSPALVNMAAEGAIGSMVGYRVSLRRHTGVDCATRKHSQALSSTPSP